MSSKTNKQTKKVFNSFSSLIEQAHSPMHCCEYCKEELKKEGFIELALNKPFEIECGKKYMVSVYDGSFFAFTIGKKVDKITAKNKLPKIRMITSHTDWPTFMIKPNPETCVENYVRLNTEPYGGMVYHTWIDRPLGIAGKICLKTDDPFAPKTVLFDSEKPVVIIPGLAIHMDRDINSDLKLNPQSHLLPLFMLNKDSEKSTFMEYISKSIGCKKDDILDYELYLYNTDSCELVGEQGELFSAPRIDNCSSVLACLDAIKNANADSNMICISAFYNNEEIGNLTKQGADSNITNQLLERIFENLNFSSEDLYCSLSEGFCLSLDVAHALHPAYTDKNDITNKVCLGDGVCIKLSSRQSYATDAAFVSVIQGLCEANNIPYGKFVNKSDQRGGSTLGSVTSAKVNIPCVDAGVPLLSMHSARELIAIDDQVALCKLAVGLFS